MKVSLRYQYVSRCKHVVNDICTFLLFTVHVCKSKAKVLNSDFKQKRRYGRSRFCGRGPPPHRILRCKEVSRIAFGGAAGSRRRRSDTPTVVSIVT